jgi:serpin B
VSQAELDLGIRLFQAEGAKQSGHNVMLSPHGVHAVLSMLLAGAKGSTESELRTLLHVTGADDQRVRDLGGLEDTLRSRPGVELGNSLWADNQFRMAPAYEQLITGKDGLGAAAKRVDFAGASDQARDAINALIAKQTHDHIPRMLTDPLDPATKLVLVSTAYLDVHWADRFDPAATQPRPFTTAAGATVDAPTMSHAGQYATAGDPNGDWTAVALPYEGGQLRMVVVVPKDLAAFESHLTPAVVDQVRAGLGKPHHLSLSVPKFSFRTKAHLNGSLSTLGAPTMFSDRADLSGITGPGGPPLAVSFIDHQTWLQVDEAGTKAAAATAGGVVATSISVFAVDRPFLFFIEDQPTGTVLFLGRVLDPTAP